MARISRKKKKDETEQECNYKNLREKFFIESGKTFSDKYGSDVVSCIEDEDKNLRYLDVGDISLQWALGRKGFALGRVLYIMGFEGAGKTSLALWIANLCIQQGGVAAMIETEQAGSTSHMKNYIREGDMRIMHPETIEDAMSMTMEMLNMFEALDPDGLMPKVLILDSIGGSSDERTTDSIENMNAPKVGGTAKLLKDSTNVIKNKLKKTNTLWVVLNQGRDKIDTGFGAGLVPDIDKVVGTGGRAIPFSATYWLILKKGAAVKEAGMKAGFQVRLMMKKNKLGEPYGEIHYTVKFGESLDFVKHTLELLEVESFLGITRIKSTGKYYSDELNIPKESPVTPDEMYRMIHQPEHKLKLQQELEIKTEDICLSYELPEPEQQDQEEGSDQERSPAESQNPQSPSQEEESPPTQEEEESSSLPD